MKRTLFLLALILVTQWVTFGQSTEPKLQGYMTPDGAFISVEMAAQGPQTLIAKYLQMFASAPTCSRKGQLYYDTVLNKARVCTATPSTWETILSGSSSAAPVDATYITQTANATLTNEQALASLATGILKNTTTTGVLSISSVTDDIQTKAAIVPNTAPSAGQVLAGNAGGTAYAPVTLSGSGVTATLSSAGVLTLSAIPSATLNLTTTTCTNQFVSTISSGGVGTCTTDTLAGAQHANQGTTTTVLHGNAAGNPSFAAVSLTADVSGVLPTANIAVALANQTSINGLGITASTGTLTITNAKTLSVSNTLTFTGTDSSSVAFGAGGTVLYNGGALGTPSSATLTNATGLPLSTGVTGTLQAAQEPAHTGDVTNSAGSLALTIAANAVTLAKLATQATNTVLGNATSGTAVPTALAVGTCSTAGSALIWTTNTGFGCNTSITAAAAPVSGLTGAGTGVLTFLATPSSANLAAAVTDETGSGVLVFGTSPVFTTSISIGSNVASTGAIRLPNNNYVYQRNAANSGDIIAFGVNGSDQLNLGNGAAVLIGGTLAMSSSAPLTLSNATFTTCTSLNTTANAVGCTASSRFLKDNIEGYNDGLAAIRQLRPTTFSFRKDSGLYDNGRQRLGFIADEVKQVIPIAVIPTGAIDGRQQVDQMALTSLTISAVKEIDKRVTLLERENASLKIRLSKVAHKRHR